MRQPVRHGLRSHPIGLAIKAAARVRTRHARYELNTNIGPLAQPFKQRVIESTDDAIAQIRTPVWTSGSEGRPGGQSRALARSGGEGR
jgi:hypothetical protein